MSKNLMDPWQFQRVEDWVSSRGGKAIIPAADALKILEEATELCYVSGASHDQVHKTVMKESLKAQQRNEAGGIFDPNGVREEFADVLITCASYAHKWNIPSQSVVDDGLGKIAARQWSVNVDGVLCRPDRVNSSINHIEMPSGWGPIFTGWDLAAPGQSDFSAPRVPQKNPGGSSD